MSGRTLPPEPPSDHDATLAYFALGIGLGPAVATILIAGTDLPITAGLVVGACFTVLHIIGAVATLRGRR